MASPINFQQLLQRLQQRFQHPLALSAAISEINDCQRFTCYLDAVLDLHPGDSPIDAIFQHACARGKLWEPCFESTANQ